MTAHHETHEIHVQALEVARRYHSSVGELLDVLIRLDQSKAYWELECTSLFSYCITHLKLSEDVALNFITVARKAVDVPALKQAVQENHITLSKARRICSVLKPENQTQW